MRLWTLHPCYLDRQGLGALWREGLGARKAIRGGGYSRHPQLERFCAPALEQYLWGVWEHAHYDRGYDYDWSKLESRPHISRIIPVTRGQVDYEREHLARKLRARSPDWPLPPAKPAVHPLFYVVPGPVESWERPK